MRSRAFLFLPLKTAAGRAVALLIRLPLLAFGHAWGLQAVKTWLGW